MQKKMKKFASARKFQYLCSVKHRNSVMVRYTENASLLPYNTFGMNVKGALLVEYETVKDLQQVLNDARVRQLMQNERKAGRLPFWHIGAGSNLLFKGDYPGVVLHCTRKVIVEVENGLQIAAGTTWDDVCAYCADKGLYGPENLSLIPGETGAAAVQNIGAYGVEFKDLVTKVICWDIEENKPHVFEADEMQYGYRESRLKHEEDKARYIVTDVVINANRKVSLHLEYKGLSEALEGISKEADKCPSAQQIRDAVIRIREGKLPNPKVLGNAGSFFKNPVVGNSIYNQLSALYPGMPHYVVDDTHTKIPAGWLIEQCGWKGKTLGNAGVYEKQSLVLVNRGGARPEEIISLCETIVKDVKEKFGICISPEVNLI